MEYRKLGETDIDVSVMALGCWPFSGGKVWGHQEDADSIATVRAALDGGINFFDTAEGYENSEAILGRGLEGRRHEAVIATKVSSGHLTEAGIESSCEKCLAALKTDYIDHYQIHWPSRSVPLDETLRALENLKSKGKVRAIGVCNLGVQDLTDLLEISRCETNQLPYSLLWRVIEREIQPLCVRENVGLICYSPLMQGLLAGRYANADEVPDGLARTRLYSKDRALADHKEPGCESKVFDALEEIRSISTELEQPMAAVSLAWARQQAGITSLLVGARNPDELQLNLPSVDLQLPAGVVDRLNASTAAVKDHLGTNPDMWMSDSRMR